MFENVWDVPNLQKESTLSEMKTMKCCIICACDCC